MAEGIKDKVAILVMGCTRFGERWEAHVLASDGAIEAPSFLKSLGFHLPAAAFPVLHQAEAFVCFQHPASY